MTGPNGGKMVFVSSLRFAAVALAFCLALVLGSAHAGGCDPVILTPSGATLAPNAADGQFWYAFEHDHADALQSDFGLSRLEVDGEYFHVSDRDSMAISAETQLLPETFATPAAAVGVRDIFNTTRNTSSVGYGGRAFYLAVRKSYSDDIANGLFRDLTVNAGVGAGSLHGPFGSVSAQMPFRLVGTFEYDSQRANLEVALPLSPTAKVEYVRIGPRGFLGVQINSPVSL